MKKGGKKKQKNKKKPQYVCFYEVTLLSIYPFYYHL